MATKKKTKKPQAKRKSPAKKAKPLKKTAKKKVSKKAATKKSPGAKTLKAKPVKAKASKTKVTRGKLAAAPKKSGRRKVQGSAIEEFPLQSRVSSPGKRSGDLQGLSAVERADSESVDELLEEGNTFEAGAVMGVEAADDAEGEEVHTHEVLEDDVPDEYLDKD
jgi:hypothetical protein